MFDELQTHIADKKVLLLGVGNRLRGDDGIGSYLVKRLKKKVNIPLIDAGDVPENYIGPIETSGANLVLIVDAADFGANPGEITLVELNQLKDFGVSTHSANLALLFKVIPKEKRPDALLVAVQPKSTETGRGLSEAVRESLDGLEHLFLQLFT
ncbi:MAG: hydrogenase 3 maturation endopeptidase HyCI [Chloroflexi bacterium]|nr:hydrogenase 3 maturation endopeptidase HyCI [Chloroflexota bacterium]